MATSSIKGIRQLSNPKLSKYKGKGYTGLSNLGNTCFLNSAMQVLHHTYEINEVLDKITTHLNSEDGSLINEWNELRLLMWSNNGVISPNKFVHGVHQLAVKKGKDLFTGWAQNDMPEFLLFIMDCMHMAIKRPVNMRISGQAETTTDNTAIECYKLLQTVYSTEYSEIMQICYGISVTYLTTMDSKTVHSIKPEQFFMLNLEILMETGQPITSLNECFRHYTKDEELVGENAWYNENTGSKEDIKKNIRFWNFPQVLVIALKRFSVDGERKLQTLVDFPLEGLNLEEYVVGYHPKSYIYDLFGICNHMGGVMGGHYTAFVKNAESKWLHYNDTQVEEIRNISQIISPAAYCLFYRKR
jgi:ubiquitin carboxyl-terminal hydrolase 8